MSTTAQERTLQDSHMSRQLMSREGVVESLGQAQPGVFYEKFDQQLRKQVPVKIIGE